MIQLQTTSRPSLKGRRDVIKMVCILLSPVWFSQADGKEDVPRCMKRSVHDVRNGKAGWENGKRFRALMASLVVSLS